MNEHHVNSGIESPSIGSHNTFSPRSRTSSSISIGSHCQIGAGCILLPNPFITNTKKKEDEDEGLDVIQPPLSPNLQPTASIISSPTPETMASFEPVDVTNRPNISTSIPSTPLIPTSISSQSTPKIIIEEPIEVVETLPDFTIIYGAECNKRLWSGEGIGQSKALHVKHLEYLREMLPKSNKLRMFL